MEDKRTLFAFLAIGLIFLLLPYYNEWMGLNPTPLEEPTLEQTQQVQDKSAEPVEGQPLPELKQTPKLVQQSQSEPTSSTPQLITREISEVATSFTPNEIVVRTPLQELILSQ